MKRSSSLSGFTLVELLLLMVVISSFIFMGMLQQQDKTLQLKLDKTTIQMQQILNAGSSYYVANGSWPTLSNLQASGIYLPASGLKSPWNGASYVVTVDTTTRMLEVNLILPSMKNQIAVSSSIIGRLPNGSKSAECNTASTAGCVITAAVNPPGLNPASASGLNYAGLYHHGSCVPVPECPVDANGNQMTPQIFVIPVSVSGLNDDGASNVYPITSFTGYATGGDDQAPDWCSGQNVLNYLGAGYYVTNTCNSGVTTESTKANKYWRACMQVVTSKGTVGPSTPGDNAWGRFVTLSVFTRCAVQGEPSGSNFTVYGN